MRGNSKLKWRWKKEQEKKEKREKSFWVIEGEGWGSVSSVGGLSTFKHRPNGLSNDQRRLSPNSSFIVSSRVRVLSLYFVVFTLHIIFFVLYFYKDGSFS
jgi:hypothetical protein